MAAPNMAHDFLELLERDTSLQTQLTVASPTTVEGVVDFASSKGFMFTKDDLIAALKDFPHSRLADQIRERIR